MHSAKCEFVAESGWVVGCVLLAADSSRERFANFVFALLSVW